MSKMKDAKALHQLKIDYLEYMEQADLLGLDVKQRGVILSLLMENDYLTQDQIMGLTGFNRKTVSETLIKLLDVSNRFHLIKTRKPRDNRNYYLCPYDLEQYVKLAFQVTLGNSQMNVEFIPSLCNRLDALSDQTDEVSHLKDFLRYWFIIVQSFNYMIENAVRGNLDNFSQDFLEGLDFIQHIKDLSMELELKKTMGASAGEGKRSDSLLQVKRAFLTKTLESLPVVSAASHAMYAIFFLLYLGQEPVNQDVIKKITGYSRSMISEALTMYKNSNMVKEIKKAGSRKKYYKALLEPVEFNFHKVLTMQGYINQIKECLTGKFLSDLEKVKLPEGEKIKLKIFFAENVKVLALLHNYSTLFNTFYNIIKDEIANYQTA